MGIVRLLILIAFFATAVTNSFSQPKGTSTPKQNETLVQSKPSVYLEFVKTGTCYNGNYSTVIHVGPCEQKSDLDEKFEAVWVRFVNNTRWAILLDVQKLAVSPVVEPMKLSDVLTVTAAKDGSELDVIYDIEAETGCDFHEEAPIGQPCKRRETPVPAYYRRGVSSKVFVASGQSILYPINQLHLKKYMTTYIFFNYAWEMRGSSTPPPRYEYQHRIYFSWFDLEIGLKSEKKGLK